MRIARSLTLWRRAGCCIALTLGTTACGPDFEDYVGAYEGALTTEETRGDRQFMSEREPFTVYVAPSSGKIVTMHLRQGCILTASMVDDGGLTFIQERCAEELAGATVDATVTAGTGTITESGELSFTVELSGTIIVREESMPYTSKEIFSGVRQ